MIPRVLQAPVLTTGGTAPKGTKIPLLADADDVLGRLSIWPAF